MKVLFACPSYKGIEYTPFLDSLEATIQLCASEGIDTQFVLMKGCCYIQEARNKLVSMFIESDADVLFFLDDDISWAAEDAVRLITSGEALIAGVYPMKSKHLQFPVVVYTTKEGVPIVRPDGYIVAKGLPTGFMCIQRSVIEKMIDAYPQQRYIDYVDGEPTSEHYDLFPQGVYNNRWVGEDYAFCMLWEKIQGTMLVAPDITFTHAGFTGNYHKFLLSQPGGSEDKGVKNEEESR